MFLILVFCFLVVVFIILSIRVLLFREPKGKKLNEEKNDEIQSLKTGDLVFVSYPNLFGEIVRAWSGSKWTHVGMIYRDPETKKLSILEVAEYNNPNFEKGVIEVPIYPWLKMNEHCEIMYKKLDQELDPEKVYSIFTQYKDKKLYKFGIAKSKWDRFLFPKKREMLGETIACTELVSIILQEFDLLPYEYSPSEFSAADIFHYIEA